MQNQNGLEGDANGLHHENPDSVEAIEASEKGWLAYFKTRNFYIVLVLGYVFCSMRLYGRERELYALEC